MDEKADLSNYETERANFWYFPTPLSNLKFHEIQNQSFLRLSSKFLNILRQLLGTLQGY
jgi:hypothetical protein